MSNRILAGGLQTSTMKEFHRLLKSEEFNQVWLAKQLHVTQSMVSRLFRGKNFVDLNLLENLADVLEYDVVIHFVDRNVIDYIKHSASCDKIRLGHELPCDCGAV